MARIKYWDEESQTWKYADKSLGVNIDLTEYAKTKDIPEKLPNPNVLTLTGAVNVTYDGSEAVEVEIPVAVTDDHINDLIDTALGVIENGSY